MNISHYPVDSNRAKLVAIQGTNQSKYLQPDYFLASSNNSFLVKKYNKVQQRISRIVSAALLSGLVLTTSVDANASSNSTVPVLPYMQDHGTQGHHTAKPMMPPPPPPPPSAFGLEMKSNITNVSGKSEGRSALLESIRNFGKGVLRKVKREAKPKVVPSDGGDLMSQLYDTLERRRKGVAGEEDSSTKPKKVVKQAPKMTEKEWQEIKKKRLEEAAEIARKNAALREYNAKVTAEAEKRKREEDAAFFRAKREQKAKERGDNTEHVVNGIDPAFHHNIVSDLRAEISFLREQLKNRGSNNLAGTLVVGSEEPIYSKPLDTISMISSMRNLGKTLIL